MTRNIASDFDIKFGYNAAAGAGDSIWYTDGDMYFHSTVQAAADIDIVSSDAKDDKDSGVGAQAIQIWGLGENFMPQTEIVPLDGLTDVHPVNDYIAIDRARCLAVGSEADNAGDITIDVNGAAPFLKIPAGFGQSQKAGMTVPADHAFAYLDWVLVSIAGNTAANATLGLAVAEWNSANSAWDSWAIKDFGTASISKDWVLCYPKTKNQDSYIKIPAKSRIKIQCLSVSTGTVPISARFHLTYGN